MKKEEFEYRIKTYVFNLIDTIMPMDGLLDRVKNATAKYWVEQNQWRLDEIVSVFTDKDGCIDEQCLMKHYENVLFENDELRLSLKGIVPENYQQFLPDKVILFKKEEFYKLLGIEKQETSIISM